MAADAFAATDPDAPMWAWGVDQHARFWMRRMLFETLVHRTDAERAVGRRPVIDPALATDGVDEFLANLPFATSFAPICCCSCTGAWTAVRTPSRPPATRSC
ncbi:TIGR03083 family protein [Streptomyces sp. SceaMP-e96]|nr:TIGR03083 family protein [Streptomyces sp. SceaMP-e96]